MLLVFYPSFKKNVLVCTYEKEKISVLRTGLCCSKNWMSRDHSFVGMNVASMDGPRFKLNSQLIHLKDEFLATKLHDKIKN